MKITKDTEVADGRKVLRERFADIRNKAQDTVAELKKNNGEDSVKVPLGRALQDTLESITNDPKRSARVAEIKNLIQTGGAAAYFKQVSSDQVAPRLAQEIDLEILTGRAAGIGGDEE
jgi:anti-sigma28 factor (negative regulator of flagellin synthesis)